MESEKRGRGGGGDLFLLQSFKHRKDWAHTRTTSIFQRQHSMHGP